MLLLLYIILALLGSTLTDFYMSATFGYGKFDTVHITNSTLAGGVAVGALLRLSMTHTGAFIHVHKHP